MGIFDWLRSRHSKCNDNLGRLISQFVLERGSKPEENKIDFWHDAICAYLFTVAWEAFAGFSGSIKSPEHLQSEIRKLITDIADDAQYWINDLMEEAIRRPNGRFGINFERNPNIIIDRLTIHFNTAFRAIDERGYIFPVARSHSCWAILAKCAEELVEDGNLEMSIEEAGEYVKTTFIKCENLASEIAQLFHKRRKRR